MSIPPWLIDLIKTSPVIGVIYLFVHFGYRTLCKAFDSPTSFAAILAIIGTRTQREAAKEMVKLLREEDETLPPAVASAEDPRPDPPRARPPRRRRRGRRRRRR